MGSKFILNSTSDLFVNISDLSTSPPNAFVNPPRSHKPLKLEMVFNIAFFEKDSFENFLNFNVASEYERAMFRGRELFKPSQKLKEYHKFINDFIFPYLDVNAEIVFSYRKGSSTYDAVSKHSESVIFYNTDIQNFFPSIGKDFASIVLTRNLKNIPIVDIETYFPKILEFLIIEDSLPVGFSTSPSFSNAVLYCFDCIMKKHYKDKGVVYTRYADDIIISSKNESDLHEVHNITARYLSGINNGKFLLNEKKTKTVRKGSKVKILGMVILPSGKISVDIKIKKKVEHLIHFYLTNKENFKKSILKDDKEGKLKNLPDNEIILSGVKTLSGILNHINTIDKPYLNKLRKKYGNVIIDMFFHQNIN
ncbi:TPA: RNA-directed DNA polymerase [Yersinia enterocolitica]|nr:RNA-directed DNA polymerase [Yersinia enterocolitica]